MYAHSSARVLPLVIGTAGHIDHGKTALIKALTGTDTDRLPEEKMREMTIDIGFAYLDLPDSRRVGIVDVPGHEAFIRNMLSGATGFGFVLLLVAADDGVMPQTMEHLYCLHFLGVREGIGVITKIDKVDKKRIDEVEKEMKGILSCTTLENIPIHRVSSITGEGIDRLREEIISKITRFSVSRMGFIFRLPVDRVFTIKGFGTVVTGTVLSGSVEVDEDVFIYPGNIRTRIRRMESHFEEVRSVVSGQRVALNLSGIERSLVERGSMIVNRDLQGFSAIDSIIGSISPLLRPLKNGDKLRVFHATREVEGRVYTPERIIKEGFTGYAHISLSEPLPILHRDRFIMRDMASSRVLGGGEVILPYKRCVKKRELREPPLSTSSLIEFLLHHKTPFLNLKELQVCLNLSPEEMDTYIPPGLVRRGDYLFSRKAWYNLKEGVMKIIVNHHKETPLSPGIRQEEIEGKLSRRLAAIMTSSPYEPATERGQGQGKVSSTEVTCLSVKESTPFMAGPVNISRELLKKVLRELESEDRVVREDHLYRHPDHRISFDEEKKKIVLTILKMLSGQAVKGKNLLEALKENGPHVREVWQVLIATGEIIHLGENFYTSRENMERVISSAKGLWEKDGVIRIQDFKNCLSIGRRDAILFLEYLDRRGLTIRDGNVRRFRRT